MQCAVDRATERGKRVVMEEVARDLERTSRTPTVRCELCRFWTKNEEDRYGRCRVSGPAAILDVDGNADMCVNWPDTYSDDWCGQWKPGAREDIGKDLDYELSDEAKDVLAHMCGRPGKPLFEALTDVHLIDILNREDP